MTINEVRVGMRVKLHPACEWFMRGAKYATITSVPNSVSAHVKLEGVGPGRLRPLIMLRDLEPTD